MSKIFIGIIAALGVSGLIYYYTTIAPMKVKLEEQASLILAQDIRDKEQEEAILFLQEKNKQTTEALSNMQSKNQQYEAEMASYLDIFRRHDLAKLATMRPGSIQIKANKATKEVFSEIEDISKSISDSDYQ